MNVISIVQYFKKKGNKINHSILAVFVLHFMVMFQGCQNSSKEKEDVIDNTNAGILEVQSTKNNKYPSVDIEPNQLLFSPASLNINSEGIWAAHEGELGIVELFNEKNEKLATAIMRSKDGNWMVSGPALFETTINFDVPEDQPGKLVFHNNVVSEEGSTKKMSFDISVRLKSNTQDALSEKQPFDKLCFASTTKAMNSNEDKYNFHFYQFEIKKDDRIEGFFISSPYGIDGSNGHFSGKLDRKNNLIIGNETYLAEGELYNENKQYNINSNEMDLGYLNAKNQKATLPKVDCESLKSIYKAYQKQNLAIQINTSDRTRILKMKAINEIGYTDAELKQLRFLEREVDLDNNYDTKEYLVYVLDKMYCGTGGCTLFIINSESKVISSTSVVNLPIYTTTTLAENAKKDKDKWKDLFVWSDGSYRQLTYKQGKYPYNASMAPEFSKETLKFHPEKYLELLDYLD